MLRACSRAVFSAVGDPANIAWWSLGGLRAPPPLKRLLAERGEHLPLFAGEMVRGADGKLRYYRPIRTAFYRAMDEEIRRHAPETTLYLCMESPEVWRDAGMGERIAGGLPQYLDHRAESMLGL